MTNKNSSTDCQVLMVVLTNRNKSTFYPVNTDLLKSHVNTNKITLFRLQLLKNLQPIITIISFLIKITYMGVRNLKPQQLILPIRLFLLKWSKINGNERIQSIIRYSNRNTDSWGMKDWRYWMRLIFLKDLTLRMW